MAPQYQVATQKLVFRLQSLSKSCNLSLRPIRNEETATSFALPSAVTWPLAAGPSLVSANGIELGFSGRVLRGLNVFGGYAQSTVNHAVDPHDGTSMVTRCW